MISTISYMDSVFLLDPEYRLRFLQYAAQLLRCAYICIWSPFPHQSANYLSCIAAWLEHEQEPGLISILFQEYRSSFCSIVSGCVPGWAFKEGLPYFELRESELISSASHQVQQQFYQESGIKTALFVGCQNGEIELGMTASSPANLQVNVHQVFSEDFIQQSLLANLLQVPPLDQPTAIDIGRLSSSSSSLPSLSVGSPEDSSLINIPLGSKSLTSEATVSDPVSVPAPHQILMQIYGQDRNLQFPTPSGDDEVMARAILAVLSSSSTTSSPSLCQVRGASGSAGAFKSYKSGLGPRVEPVKTSGLGPQWMAKSALGMLRRMHCMRYQARMEPEVVMRPTGSQLHHMISERKRREKLNESFDALRNLLPPGSKKDKASVLSKTKDYLSTLKAQINELEEKNKKLEMQLSNNQQTRDKAAQEVHGSRGSIHVEVTTASESTSDSQQIHMQIIVRQECDLTDLIIRVLGCLKEIGAFTLLSVDASSDLPQFAQADFRLLLMADDYDEASLKEAVKRVVEDAVAHKPEMQ